MLIKRAIYPLIERSKKSILLLGPRQTGKSTFISHFNPDLTINLALETTYLEFARNPGELEQRLSSTQPKSVFIDEIQRLPSLLNTIQVMIDRFKDKGGLKFYLTGSSARKLRRGQANLLPGRVHVYHLGPLIHAELGEQLNLHQSLRTGCLPGIYTDPDDISRVKTLKSYCATYLKEEIQAEALTRNIEGFSRFLYIIAASSGQFLDFSKLSSEARISRQSAIRYFEILEDTLILNRSESFSKSYRKRLIQHPKFYFFDVGILNALLNNFEASQDRIGPLFEHFFFNQLFHGSAARDLEIRISTFRTEHGAEVDFIVEMEKTLWAIELKASQQIDPRWDIRGLKKFGEFYQKPHRSLVVYLGSIPKKIEKIEILPWQRALEELGL